MDKFLTIMILLFVGSSVGNARPNFVIVYTDDQGYGDVSSYGADSLETPHLDKIAGEGIRLTSFYSGFPVCSPSRATLLTGNYSNRVQMGNNLGKVVVFPPDKIGLNPNEVTLADLLKANGYKTAHVGKWHLGHEKRFLPTRQGFDYYYGVPYSNDMVPTRLMYMEQDIDTLGAQGRNPKYDPRQGNLTSWCTDSALAFIEENRDTSFFVYLAHSMPHIPVYVSDEFQNHNKFNWLYGGVIEEIDFHTGRLVDSLKAWGLDSNTLFLFSSDNGPWKQAGTWNTHGRSGPLRGHKGGSYEGGMRVPGIFWGPGYIPPNQVSDEVTGVVDLYKTFANLAGVNLPRNRVTDGEDIMPILRGTPGAKRQSPFYYELNSIRIGDWKFMQNRRINNKYTHNVDELYNLKNDIGEKNNLSAQFPALADSLKDLLIAFRDEVNANVRPHGTMATEILKQGCTDNSALNYDDGAGVDNGTCQYTISTSDFINTADKTLEISGNDIQIIKANAVHLTIMDLNGRLVKKFDVRNKKVLKISENIKNGVYWIKLDEDKPVRWVYM